MSAKNNTQVIIAGKIYTLSGYESEEYLQRVASYLNGKISEFRNLDGYYEFKHEMITAQIRLENAEKEAKALEERNAQLQKELVRLEAQRDA